MKNLFLLTLLAMLVFACNSNESGDDEQSSASKKYEVKSGYIVYKMSMMGMDTKTTMYFKDYGKTEASVTELNLMGQQSTTKMLRKDEFVYQYSVEQKSGTKIKMTEEEMASNGEAVKLDEKTIVDEMGGKKIGTEEVLGKECTVYEVNIDNAESKYWIWKNLIFKMVARQDEAEVTMEAVEFKETSDFPAGTFEVPADINFSDPSTPSDFDQEDAEG